jgi:hypothetical protein
MMAEKRKIKHHCVSEDEDRLDASSIGRENVERKEIAAREEERQTANTTDIREET